MATYCTSAELSQYGIRSEALRGFTDSELQAAIGAASDVIDSYLRSRFLLPLTAWGSGIRRLCAKIAVYDLMVVRGFNASRAGDEQIQAQYDDAMQALRDFSNEKATPDVTDSSSGASAGEVQGGGTVQVSSYRSRGYFAPDSQLGHAFQGRR
jgi:phage gp36-like protein